MKKSVLFGAVFSLFAGFAYVPTVHAQSTCGIVVTEHTPAKACSPKEKNDNRWCAVVTSKYDSQECKSQRADFQRKVADAIANNTRLGPTQAQAYGTQLDAYATSLTATTATNTRTRETLDSMGGHVSSWQASMDKWQSCIDGNSGACNDPRFTGGSAAQPPAAQLGSCRSAMLADYKLSKNPDLESRVAGLLQDHQRVCADHEQLKSDYAAVAQDYGQHYQRWQTAYADWRSSACAPSRAIRHSACPA